MSAEPSPLLRTVGDHPVDLPTTCVVTRFALESPWKMLQTISDYRRVLRAAAESRTPGLFQAVLALDTPTSCVSISIWRDEASIAAFGTAVPEHVVAARSVFARLKMDAELGPELWSTKWRIASVSSNLNWRGFDLARMIAHE